MSVRAGVLGILFLSVGFLGRASASTYVVDVFTDSHDSNAGDNVCLDSSSKCSLRAALEEANAHAGTDTVQLSAGTYTLSSGTCATPMNVTLCALQITQDVTIDGGGGATIDANNLYPVVNVNMANPADVAFFYTVTLTNGNDNHGSSIAGGAMKIVNGDTIMLISNVTNSQSGVGGGAIAVSDGLELYYSTIDNNKTPLNGAGGVQFSGGGILVTSGANVFITHSTISNNQAVRGGGIAGDGFMDVTNSTISGNKAQAGGGGFLTMSPTSSWAVSFSTITNNEARIAFLSEPIIGGGILHRAGFFGIGESIIAGNDDHRNSFDASFSPDCATADGSAAPFTHTGTPIVSANDNLWGVQGPLCDLGDWSGGTSPFDFIGTPTSMLNPQIGGLAYNGGYGPLTHALNGASAAIDAYSGNVTGYFLFDCPGDDETLFARPDGAACDSGSYEF